MISSAGRPTKPGRASWVLSAFRPSDQPLSVMGWILPRHRITWTRRLKAAVRSRPKRAATPCANREPPVASRPLCRKVASQMSLPTSRRPRHDGGRWDTIRYALESWPRTLRLCLILLVTIAAPVAAAALAELIRHMLLCGAADDGRRPAIPGTGSTRPVGGGRSTAATAGGRSTTRANGRRCCSAAGRCSVTTSCEARRLGPRCGLPSSTRR